LNSRLFIRENTINTKLPKSTISDCVIC